MKQTSIESFHKLNPSKTHRERQAIYEFLKRWMPTAYSDRDISKATGLPVNVVQSRRNDLHKRYRAIEYAGEIYDRETNRHVQSWRATR